jgi:hypothetical protein
LIDIFRCIISPSPTDIPTTIVCGKCGMNHTPSSVIPTIQLKTVIAMTSNQEDIILFYLFVLFELDIPA